MSIVQNFGIPAMVLMYGRPTEEHVPGLMIDFSPLQTTLPIQSMQVYYHLKS